jgi:hypothetical protein
LINENKYDNEYENIGEKLGEGSVGHVFKMKSVKNSNK